MTSAFTAVSMRFLLLFLATTAAFKIPLDVVSVTPSTDSAAVVSPDAEPTPVALSSRDAVTVTFSRAVIALGSDFGPGALPPNLMNEAMTTESWYTEHRAALDYHAKMAKTQMGGSLHAPSIAQLLDQNRGNAALAALYNVLDFADQSAIQSAAERRASVTRSIATATERGRGERRRGPDHVTCAELV